MARAAGTAASARRSGRMRRRFGSAWGMLLLRSPCAAPRRTLFVESAAGARIRRSMRGTAPHRCCVWRPRSRRSTPGLRSSARPRELGAPEEVVAVSADEVRARCDSPLFLGGARFRLNATVHPARLALGLRAKLLERGARIHERTQVTKLHPDGSVETRSGRVSAGSARTRRQLENLVAFPAIASRSRPPRATSC